ncbi:hypothetical protein [Prauserella alba]|uniref:Uncharacterized protein n=1 Tax=Prauserella alba TaxID=176898 RepID=A0ABP4FLE2_9PSEU|nr:hypothetical protein [Prauserella alba]MCP2178869.1 hypothetical protein [Prauserella alba]
MTSDYSDDMAALSRLVLAGWQGTPIGNPAAPEVLVYVRPRSAYVDSVYVTGPDRATAIRKNMLGSRLRNVDGTCAEVVNEVLGW